MRDLLPPAASNALSHRLSSEFLRGILREDAERPQLTDGLRPRSIDLDRCGGAFRYVELPSTDGLSTLRLFSELPYGIRPEEDERLRSSD
mmetsp:Transcript_29310/g.49958  ORF Transcript_29310/g.49958 Transcript_29310/m.49958 type:complete len:90 (-) Transcript_29310:140-409(-)